MDFDKFFGSPSQFKEELYRSGIKLSEVTKGENKRFYIEQIRFWRRHELLPFFEDGNHAQITMAQWLWISLLVSMRNFGCSVANMKGATEYFIKRAYDDKLVMRNFLRLEEQYSKQLSKNDKKNNQESPAIPFDEIEFRLQFIRKSLKDPFLLNGLQMDINYFSSAVLLFLDSGEPISIVINEKGFFGLMMNDDVLDISYDKIEPHSKINKEEPFICIPIKYLLKDFFSDDVLEETSLNIKVLTESEREIIQNLRAKRVVELNIKLRDGEIKRYDIVKETRMLANKKAIEDIKASFGLKNYQEINFSMINDHEVIETKKIKRIISK